MGDCSLKDFLRCKQDTLEQKFGNISTLLITVAKYWPVVSYVTN